MWNFRNLSQENSADSYLCFRLALLHSVSYFFFLYQSPSSALCTVFYSISSNMRFSQSTHLLMFLSLETLISIIRTGLPILVKLIDLMNSVITFLSRETLLTWLTFLLGSQTAILSVLLFWSISSDASICSTMGIFPPLENSDHAVISVFIDFPSYSQQDALFHRIACD